MQPKWGYGVDLVGQVLGKYRIVEKIGSGGMADVFKGLQVGLEREVAIKVLPPTYAKDLDRLKRFRRESQATAKLSHPNIITIYDSGEQDGYYFYVMEYLKDESLATLIKREGPLDLKQGLKIGKDVLKALVYTHDKSIIHRDLKPDNIRFDLRGNAIVTDFGLVKDLQETSLTMTGISIGTPQYMSPEQLHGEEVDERSDIYQLGVLLYEMFCGTTVGELLSPKERNSELPDDLCELILCALAKESGDRFQSAEVMLQALTKVERKFEARQASNRSASSATRGFSTRSLSTSRALSTAAPTLATDTAQIQKPERGGFYHSLLSLLAGPNYQEQTQNELLYNASMVVLPGVLTCLLLVLYVTDNLFPRPELRLLEQAIEEQSERAVLAWKTNAPCYSYIEYYTSLDTRQRSTVSANAQNEFRTELTNLDSDTTYYFQFVFTYDPDDPESFVYSKELELKTKPEVRIFSANYTPGARHVQISWNTNVETDTLVRIGTSQDYSREQRNEDQIRETDHSIRIDGLERNTRYHFVIVATDPDQEGKPKFSQDYTFRTRDNDDPILTNPSNEAPLVELAKSYVDKLTRMTPDERKKLEQSLDQYLIINADKTLTVEKKREIIAGTTNGDNFNDRLRYFKVWMEQLDKSGIKHGLNPRRDAILQSMNFINPKKSHKRLDEALQKLDEKERQGRGT